MAAGEALALCVELNLTQHIPCKDMEALQGKVSELASDSQDRGVDNATLPQQKDLFQQTTAFLNHGERPERSLPTSMEKCIALQDNELFNEAFSYGADEGKVLSVAKKKHSGKMDRDLKVKSEHFCRYPYTAHNKPETLLQIGWKKLN
ncbi:hypothetical protein PR202_ga06920 [Eleusine coracana subsp. coracana]|uniref:Uncharacterized protein n=1 Tax=Eleusine coracana subsp. coracana TaxID=191504 RepID=A0AAV5BYA7_ELECO|nr:hypothetical protein PR202_ga06920 [Eleusine coracana subsp. coracana]